MTAAANTNDFDEKGFSAWLNELYFQLDQDAMEQDHSQGEREAEEARKKWATLLAEEAAPVVVKSHEAPRDEPPAAFVTGGDAMSILEGLLN